MPIPSSRNRLLERIGRARDADRLAHALLVIPAEAEESWETALAIARGILCREPGPGMVPCAACPSCRTGHPDLHLVEPPEGKRWIPIDAIRELQRGLSLTPHAGGWRVGCMREAHELSGDAVHACLKLLEEPPPRTLLLLVTPHPTRLPATIRSRCQTVRLPAVGNRATDPPPDADEARGILGLPREEIETALHALLGRKTPKGKKGTGEERRNAARSVLDGLTASLRDRVLAATRTGRNPAPDARRLEGVLSAYRDLDGNANPAILLDALADLLEDPA